MASISAALKRCRLQFSIKPCQLSTDGTLCASSLEYTKTDHTAKSLINLSKHKQNSANSTFVLHSKMFSQHNSPFGRVHSIF